MSLAGLLTNEHRIIEHIFPVLSAGADRMLASRAVDTLFIDRTTDFFRNYADRCHHGKEEDILFRALAEKPLSAAHRKTMSKLAEEHVYARGQVGQLLLHKDAFLHGDSAGYKRASAVLKEITVFYPKHIELEEGDFFVPVMEYFTRQEQETMLREFLDFDQRLLHEKYRLLIEEMQKA